MSPSSILFWLCLHFQLQALYLAFLITSLLGRPRMSPLLSSRSRCCCCHPLNCPALASPRSALIQSPYLFGETIPSELWTTSLLNFYSICVPLPHNSVLKVFLVLSAFMFIITFDPHDTCKLDKAVIIPILEMRKLKHRDGKSLVRVIN